VSAGTTDLAQIGADAATRPDEAARDRIPLPGRAFRPFVIAYVSERPNLGAEDVAVPFNLNINKRSMSIKTNV